MGIEPSPGSQSLPCLYHSGGELILRVRVRPKAARNEWVDVTKDAAVVRIAAPPVDGKANRACLGFVAKSLGVPRRALRIVGGEKGRTKRITVKGYSRAEVAERIRTYL